MNRKPCMDCEKRHEKCHATCEDYIAFKEDLKARKEWLKQQNGEAYFSPGMIYNPNLHKFGNKPRGINPKAVKHKLKGGQK